MLRLNLFGGFALRSHDSQDIKIELAKSRALLSYLAIHAGRSMDRGQLASLLWGGQPEARARHSLTQTLSSLAQTLGPDAEALERGRRTICLKTGYIEVDLVHLLAMDTPGDPTSLVRTVELFENEVLGEFSFDEPDFDEWVLLLREECREKVLRVGVTYLATDTSQSEDDSRLRVARKLLRIDPFCEAAYRALMEDLLKRGDIAAARKQAKICLTVLNEELGIDPSPETQRLIKRVQASGGLAATNAGESNQATERGDLPEKPSIVVLALENLTGDPQLHHIGQGLSDDITTELSRYRSLFVISRESAFQLSAGPEDVSHLCRRLGVRHAFCGSLRPYRGRFRINLRLVEGRSGQAIWSEKFDFDREALFEISDAVVENLVARLSASLEDDALARARRRPPKDWTAYDHLLQGLVHHHRSWYGTGNLFGAVKHFKRAIELDPELAAAHAYLACAISAPWYKDRELASLDRCLDHAQRAVELDPFEAEAQRILGGIYLVRSEHELSDHHFAQALRAHPGNAHILAHAAKYQAHVGAHGDAVSLVNKARQLNPLHPAWYWQHLGVAHFGQENFPEAIRTFSRLPFFVFYDRLYLAAAKAHLGDRKAAGRHLQIALQDKPDLNRKTVARYLPYSRPKDLKAVVKGLTLAGLA